MILILTRAGDEHTYFVAKRLREKKARFVEFETATFPEGIWSTLAFNSHSEIRRICVGGQLLDLREVQTVWNRRPMPSEPAPHLGHADREFVLHESMHVIQSFWRLLSRAFWVNHFIADLNARFKPYQLEIAQQLGFVIPRTLITNNPADVLPFFDSCGGKVIYKCFSNHGRIENGRGYGIFTSLLDRSTLVRHVEQVRRAPCTFQEYVDKRVELRVTVIGQAVFTAEIDSQSSDFSQIDWRRTAPDGRDCYAVPQRRFSLPSSVERKILMLMNRLGLVFGCLDFIITPTDELVFLEINPNGQWYWIEEVTGMPMLEAFTEMLIQGRTDYLDMQSVKQIPTAAS